MVNTIILHFEEHDRRIFWTLAGVFAVVLSAYVYFLSISVFAVIARKEAEQQTGEMNAQISQLESQYVVLDKGINLALARERGFSDISTPRYVSPEVTPNTLSLREERTR